VAGYVGSTNAVLHLLAIARAVGVKLSLDDFQEVSDRIPFIADLKPRQVDMVNCGTTR
jgi:dihydroxy-acid dehydratase